LDIFLIQATGLYHTQQKINESADYIVESKIQATLVQEQLSSKKLTLEKLKAEVDEVIELMKIEEDIKEYQAKLLSHEISNLDSVILNLKKTLQKKQSELEEVKTELIELENASASMENIEETKAKIETINVELEVCKNEFELKHKAVNDKQRQINTCQHALDEAFKYNANLVKRLEQVKKEV
jgi:chromosome segregation ATPase